MALSPSTNRPPIAAHAVLIAVTALFGAPLFFLLLASVKTPVEIREAPFQLWPEVWSLDNYSAALQAMPYVRYLANTLILCVGSVAGTLLSCSLVAYGLSRVEWRGRSICFALVMTTMLLPWQVTMVPRFLLVRQCGLYNSLGALVLPTLLGDAFFIFLLRQFFLTIPTELSEAARMDGLSEWGIFWRIILPLSRPALMTVALFQFIATWNDFSGPLLYLSDPDQFPLAYGLEQFVSAYSDQTHLLLAAAVMFTLPIIVLFFITQRTFVRGIATTGLKG